MWVPSGAAAWARARKRLARDEVRRPPDRAPEKRMAAATSKATRQALADRQRPLPALRIEIRATQRAAGRERGHTLAALGAISRMHGLSMPPGHRRPLNGMSVDRKRCLP